MEDMKKAFEDYLLLRKDLFRFYPKLKNPFEVTAYREAPNGNADYIAMTYVKDGYPYRLEFFAFKVQDLAESKLLRASRKWLRENALCSIWLMNVTKGKDGMTAPELAPIYRTAKSGKKYILPRFASMKNAEKIAKEAYDIIRRGE